MILNFIRIGGDLLILDEFDFFIFFIVTSNYKNSMYPRSFLCEEAKIKQSTPLKKELCEIGEEAIWESRFTSFFSFQMNLLIFLNPYEVFQFCFTFSNSILKNLKNKRNFNNFGCPFITRFYIIFDNID